MIKKNHKLTTGARNIKIDAKLILDEFNGTDMTHILVGTLKRIMHERFGWNPSSLSGCIPNTEKGRLTDYVKDEWSLQKINNRNFYVKNEFCMPENSTQNDYDTPTKRESRKIAIDLLKSVFHFNKSIKVLTLGSNKLYCVEQIGSSFRNSEFVNLDDDEEILNDAKALHRKRTRHVLGDFFNFIMTEDMSVFHFVNADLLGYISSGKEPYFIKLNNDNPDVISITIQNTKNFRKGNKWAKALNSEYNDSDDKIVAYMNNLFSNYHNAVVHEYRRTPKSAKMKQLIFKSKTI